MLRKNYTLRSPHSCTYQRLNRQWKPSQLTVDNEQKEIHSQRMKAGKKNQQNKYEISSE